MAVRPRRISDIKPLITNLAQTSHYEVKFGTMHPQLQGYLSRKGINSRFIAEDAGLLCYSAVLPTTSLMTANITGNFTGITENFAHTRQYDSISLDFYVDKNYQTLNFLECWMEFITSGSGASLNSDNYFVRVQYPEYYKANSVKIIKFDRDYVKEIEYNFRGLFPSSISSIQVGYTQSDILKMSATFLYDRYIAGKANSLDIFQGTSYNQQFNTDILQEPQSAEDISRQIDQNFSFSADTNQSFQSTADSLSKNPLSTQSSSSFVIGQRVI